MFKEERNELTFCWGDLGNIREGRPNLGDSTSVTVYRLMQYTLRDVLIKRFGPDTSGEIFYEAGKSAGKEFCKNVLDKNNDFNGFIAELQKVLKDQNIGIMRVEKVNLQTLDMTITVAEDLDCSGLPMTDETVCNYDEGFIAGILEAYTGKTFHVKEIDCWASGARVCRFEVKKKLCP
jgi:uncharacterized protein